MNDLKSILERTINSICNEGGKNSATLTEEDLRQLVKALESAQVENSALRELIREPMEYAESRPQGERGWKRWLTRVKDSVYFK
jgi:hypothetical protein